MKKSTGIIVMAVLIAVALFALVTEAKPVERRGAGLFGRHGEVVKEHFRQQRDENRALHKSLKDLSPEERLDAIKEHYGTQHSENIAFFEELHDKAGAALRERLANSDKLTEEQKQEILGFFEQQYHENVAFRDGRYADTIAFFTDLFANESLTPEEIREAVKEYMGEVKAATKAHWQEQRAEWRAKREKFHANAGPR